MTNEALLKKAESKIATGQFNKAIKIYFKILRKNPDHLNALFLLGTLFATQNKMGEAIHYLEKATQVDADIFNLQINLGNVYKATGALDQAKECYIHALKLDPDHARAHHCLGTIFFEDTKQQDRAAECFKKALSLDPNIGEAHFGYGTLLINNGNSKGLEHLEQAYRLNPHQPGLLYMLGNAYLKSGKDKEAIPWFEKALKQNPDDTLSKYLLCIAEGKKPAKELREKYIEKMFDKFSDSFEELLVEKLGYKIPSIVREKIKEIYGNEIKFNNIADLGCGTGLGGLAFRDCAERLTGIDISTSMLEKAAQKNIYDSLLHGEIINTLENFDSFFDFFLATDLFVHLQELDLLFATISERASSGAVLAFSTESNDVEDFVIRESGRTAHNPRYIHNLAKTFNIKIVSEERFPIRKEHEKWIEGDLFICELP